MPSAADSILRLVDIDAGGGRCQSWTLDRITMN